MPLERPLSYRYHHKLRCHTEGVPSGRSRCCVYGAWGLDRDLHSRMLLDHDCWLEATVRLIQRSSIIPLGCPLAYMCYHKSCRTAEGFWATVREMGSEQKAKLLHFCTGASRPPAAGFEYLMGYMGAQARFKLQKSMAGSNWLHGSLFCGRKLHSRTHSPTRMLG
jgi:hypothetical protein